MLLEFGGLVAERVGCAIAGLRERGRAFGAFAIQKRCETLPRVFGIREQRLPSVLCVARGLRNALGGLLGGVKLPGRPASNAASPWFVA